VKKFAVSALVLLASGAFVSVSASDLAEASAIARSYAGDACANSAIVRMDDAYKAFVESEKARAEGKPDQAQLYAACAIQLGGAAALYNFGSRFREAGDDRALDYLLAGALLGSRRAQRESGEMLLKSAVSERQRLIALNLLVRSQEGCEGVDNLALLEYAESSRYPPAVIAAHTWLRVNLEEIKRTGKASGYFSGWLRNLEGSMTEAMQRESEAAAKILLRDRGACGR
jgi:hypothetical protein